MLNDFIFLGQIPGTNFFITFYELEVASRFALLFAAVYVLWRVRNHKSPLPWNFNNPTLQSFVAVFSLPAQSLGRISLTPQASNGPDQLDLFGYQLPPDA